MTTTPIQVPGVARVGRERASSVQQAMAVLPAYELGKNIGEGGFAKVKVGTHKLTGEKVAIKIVDKTKLSTTDRARLKREVEALKGLQHQNICQLYEYYETEDRAYLVLEGAVLYHDPFLSCLLTCLGFGVQYCERGELFDYIVARERLKESEAQRFFRQIVVAVGYCHRMGYVHRDLKPENLLLNAQESVKLIDFGLVGKPSSPDHLLQTCCGSPAYAAPELIRGEPYIGVKADMWSMGVLLYALLCGFLPFDHDNVNILYQLIERGQYYVPPFVSHESSRLIGLLLQPLPENRPTIDELLTHPWLTKGCESQPPLCVLSNVASLIDYEVAREVAGHYGLSVHETAEHICDHHFDFITTTYYLLCRKKAAGKSFTLPRPEATDKCVTPSKGRASPSTPLRKILSVPRPIHSVGSNSQSPSSATSSHAPINPATLPIAIPDSPLENPFKTKTRSKSCDTDPMEMLGSSMPGARSYKMPIVSDETGSDPILSFSVDGVGSMFERHRSTRGAHTGSERTDRRSNRRSTLDQVTTAVLSAFRKGEKEVEKEKEKEKEKVEDRERKEERREEKEKEKEKEREKEKEKEKEKERKSEKSTKGYVPRIVDGPFNADTTSPKTATAVLQELIRVLIENEVQFTQKEPFLLVCRKRDDQGRLSLCLEMEICRLERLQLVGVRLRRLKGDFMRYKQLAHTLLQAANL